jgi:hypothetical protein
MIICLCDTHLADGGPDTAADDTLTPVAVPLDKEDERNELLDISPTFTDLSAETD